jgi:hypothetical protein
MVVASHAGGCDGVEALVAGAPRRVTAGIHGSWMPTRWRGAHAACRGSAGRARLLRGGRCPGTFGDQRGRLG